ncbi:MAG: beta-propeller domain-containing protein [Deltaproteobacteria bacterium]|nr:beta-propeller domain-containing protein [Deltaproteobacteria bacterium]
MLKCTYNTIPTTYFTRLFLVSAILIVPACSKDNDSAKLNAPPAGTAYLRTVQNCAELEATIKQQLIAKMREQVEQNLERAIEYGEFPCWRNDIEYAADAATPTVGQSTTGGTSKESGAQEYSTTNNQVAGVDEADFIENDNKYIYMVSGNEFIIFAAWPVDTTRIIGRYTIEGTPQRLFVAANRALIYSTVASEAVCGSSSENGVSATSIASDIYYPYQTGKLKITVLDITDLTAPKLEREINFNGEFVAGRRIDNTIHTVIRFAGLNNISYSTWPEDAFDNCSNNYSESQLRAMFSKLIDKNINAINALDFSDIWPTATDIDHDGDETLTSKSSLYSDCNSFYAPTTTNSDGFLSVVSLNIADDSNIKATTIAGKSDTVYASLNNLYVAATSYERIYSNSTASYDYFYNVAERTVIHQFALSDTGEAPRYVASGQIAGRLVNQFALDEYDNHLRVASTEGHLPNPNTSNNVFVLKETQTEDKVCAANDSDCKVEFTCDTQYCCAKKSDCSETFSDDDANCVVRDGLGTCELYYKADASRKVTRLKVVGSVKGLAPSEDIRAVRFDGKRGYMVTFKKTDPLFTFDLTDPTNPQTTGELKIPGFSTYIHFLDDNHLLTIGFDASEQGSFAWFTGIQLQIFDVSDLASPLLMHKVTIGTRGTTSDATDDHLAFNYFASRGLLAVPMGICEGGDDDGGYGSELTFNGLLLYQVSIENGLTEIGRIDHHQGDENESCYNWWSSPNSQVKRSVFMENYVYSVSSELLKVNDVNALSPDLVNIELPQLEASNTELDKCLVVD